MHFLSSMIEQRQGSVAAHHEQLGFLITGGEKSAWNDGWQRQITHSSTEITKDGLIFESFTELPFLLSRHCLVALDVEEGEFFLGGGLRGGYDANWNYIPTSTIGKAFFHRGNQWIEVPAMPTARNSKKPNLELHNEFHLKLILAGVLHKNGST